MKVVAIVQARIGSTRLPGKVLAPVVGMPIIQILLARLSKSNALDEIIVATSEDQQDDQLQTLVEKLGYRCLKVVRKMCSKEFMKPPN